MFAPLTRIRAALAALSRRLVDVLERATREKDDRPHSGLGDDEP